MDLQHKIETYWQDEGDWLCTIDFLPGDDPKGRLFGADIVGYLFGYAQLTNTRVLALIGCPDAGAYDLLFSFLSPAEKKEFLKLVRSNEDMGNHCVAEFTQPTAKEIRNARPLAMVLPQDALTQAMRLQRLCGWTSSKQIVKSQPRPTCDCIRPRRIQSG